MRYAGRFTFIVATFALLILCTTLVGRYVHSRPNHESAVQLPVENAEEASTQFLDQLFLRNSLQSAQKLASSTLSETMSSFGSADNFLRVVTNIQFEQPLTIRIDEVHMSQDQQSQKVIMVLSGKAYDGTIGYETVVLTLSREQQGWRISDIDPSAV